MVPRVAGALVPGEVCGIVPRKILAPGGTKRPKRSSNEVPDQETKGASETKTLRVRDLAALCGVEQKTVHNWVARGMIPFFRTPGRHLRFLPEEVTGFV